MIKNKISNELLNLANSLRDIGFSDDLVNFINKSIINRFPEAKEKSLTINQYISKLEDDPNQYTVVLTSEVSYFCVKSYLAFHADKFVSEKTNGYIRVLDREEYKKKEDYNNFRQFSFDVVFQVGDSLVPLEIKVSQGNDSFLGATHSTTKVNDYLLISLEINRDIVVNDDVKFVKGIFMSITNIDKTSWVGEASNNNSRTSYKFKMYDMNWNMIDYSDGIIAGCLLEKKLNYSIIRKRVD